MESEAAITLRSALDQMKSASDQMKSASDQIKSASDQMQSAYTSFATATEIIVEAFLKQTTSTSTRTEEVLSVELKAMSVNSDHATNSDGEQNLNEAEVALNDESASIAQSPATNRKRTVTTERSQVRSKISRSMSLDVRKALTARPLNTAPTEPLTSNAAKVAKAAKVNRPRQTISLNHHEAVQAELMPAIKNINPEQHAKNTLYNRLCLYCGSNERFLLAHYLKHHPELEVPIARPSPEMTNKIQEQVDIFETQDRKIKGICYFCEDTKEMNRYNWAQHYVRHTGELIYACDTCDKQFDRKVQKHPNCSGEVLNITEINSSDTGVVSFMCKECNYMQFQLSSMEKHLKEQHKWAVITEGQQYDKVTLIPDMLPVQTDILDEYNLIESRFVCTVCHAQSLTEDDFIKHFDERHNGIMQYDCLCGEKVAANGGPLTGKAISDHLCLHSDEFYQCLLCDKFFDGKIGIRGHIVTEHRASDNIKYRQFHRTPDQRSKTYESLIKKFKCNLCQKQLKATFETLFNHFNEEHNGNGDATVSISKKATFLDDKSSKGMTRYVGNAASRYQISEE